MFSVLPSGVGIVAGVKTPLSIICTPWTDRSATPSGAEILKLPVVVSDSFAVSDPAGRSSSSTIASPPFSLGVRLVIVTPSSVPVSDRKSVVEGKSVSVRVDLGGRRYIKKKKKYNKRVLLTYA